MAVNLASKFSSKVDERFKLNSLSESFINSNYDWTGVRTVKVYFIPTVEETNYTSTGLSRYGTPSELQDNVQDLTVSQDKAFTFTIDKGNENSQMGAKNVGKAVRRQTDEVSIPNTDVYRFGVISAAGIANSGTAVGVPSANNAYSLFLDGQSWLDDHKVPLTGRIAAVTPAFYKFLKLDPSFIKNSDLGQKITIKGQVGEVDGVKIVKVPTSYLPTGVNFFITHSSVSTSPKKIDEVKTHLDPPGINGYLVEGRRLYDCFVLNNKKDGIFVSTKS